MSDETKPTTGHIEREARALAACDGKDFWAAVSWDERVMYRAEAKVFAYAARGLLPAGAER